MYEEPVSTTPCSYRETLNNISSSQRFTKHSNVGKAVPSTAKVSKIPPTSYTATTKPKYDNNSDHYDSSNIPPCYETAEAYTAANMDIAEVHYESIDNGHINNKKYMAPLTTRKNPNTPASQDYNSYDQLHHNTVNHVVCMDPVQLPVDHPGYRKLQHN